MADTDKRKQSLYFPAEMLNDIRRESIRLDRSLSWIVQFCWRRAAAAVRALESVNDTAKDDDDAEDTLARGH